MEKTIRSSGEETLYELLCASAKRFGQKPALYYLSSMFTYDRVLDEVNRLADLLYAQGVRGGDRVFIAMPNSPAFAITYFAAFRLGAIAVPLSTCFTPSEMASLIAHSKPTAGVVSEEMRQAVEESVKLAGISAVLVTTGWDAAGEIRYSVSGSGAAVGIEQSTLTPADPAVILYTSGTTGSPKGVVLSHRNIMENARSCLVAMPVSEADVFIAFLPMYHSFAFTVCTILPILLGSTCVVLPGPKKELIAAAVKRFSVTVFIGIPALYGILARADAATVSLFDSVRFFVSGAAPLPLSTIEAFGERYRGPLLEGYGLTEAAPVVSFNPFNGVRKAGSIGVPVPMVSIRVVDESGKDLPPDEIGELLVKGPNVMAGYFGDDAATRDKIRDGWLYTGDMARIDRDGYIYIEDRKDDMILVQGANVYPHEIEDLIKSIPGVIDVAVVGVADSHLGKRPVAVVQCAKGASLDEATVLAHCREHLSGHKAPRRVHFWDTLPLSPLGKPLKRKIREMLKSESKG